MLCRKEEPRSHHTPDHKRAAAGAAPPCRRAAPAAAPRYVSPSMRTSCQPAAPASRCFRVCPLTALRVSQ